MAALTPTHLSDPVLNHARKDFAEIDASMTVGEALERIRRTGVGEKIVYFYVVDTENRLVGIVPTRRLLSADLSTGVADIMIRDGIVTVPSNATVQEASQMFLRHRFLALPVVDDERHMVGVIDVSLFTDEIFDMSERRQADAVFESIGVRLAQVRDASPLKAFRYRMPWLLATITSGTLCALLAGAFEATLAQSLVLAFFLTLVLGLGESVSMQSMTLTIQFLATQTPTRAFFRRAIRRELLTAMLLGLCCGLIVAAVVILWQQAPMPALAIGLGIMLSIIAACCFGVAVPTLLHVLKLDPKIAAGPITLALADIFTLLFYFTLATLLL